MSGFTKPLFNAKQAEGTEFTQYTAGLGVRTIIDKFTGTNTTATPATLTVRLVPSGGVAGVSNTITSAKTLQAGEEFTFPAVVGHTLNPGDFISTLAGTAAAITIRASGREIT